MSTLNVTTFEIRVFDVDVVVSSLRSGAPLATGLLPHRGEAFQNRRIHLSRLPAFQDDKCQCMIRLYKAPFIRNFKILATRYHLI